MLDLQTKQKKNDVLPPSRTLSLFHLSTISHFFIIVCLFLSVFFWLGWLDGLFFHSSSSSSSTSHCTRLRVTVVVPVPIPDPDQWNSEPGTPPTPPPPPRPRAPCHATQRNVTQRHVVPCHTRRRRRTYPASHTCATINLFFIYISFSFFSPTSLCEYCLGGVGSGALGY